MFCWVVVRPVIFLAYSGEMRWQTRAGDEITGTLGAPMTPADARGRLKGQPAEEH